MDKDGQRALLVLQEIEKNPIITQRTLSQKLGVALGLTNLYLKRLVRKGCIKITMIPRNRIRYFLTSRGIKEKSRLTYEYLQFSLTYYRDVRHRLSYTLAIMEKTGVKRVVIFGVGELAELVYMSVQECTLELVGFVTDSPGDLFLSFPRITLETLSDWNFDAVFISELGNVEDTKSRIYASGIPPEQVFSVV
ncbi:MAG: transcriptional regulator [Nitrospirales bacterium]|nr:MAG: transcriptional regulator [Nitrospirales bacterium]